MGLEPGGEGGGNRALIADAKAYAEKIERIVTKGDMRKYKRFRATKYYGGCVTADCVGCFLRCWFCWVWKANTYPEKYGRFYFPCDVVEKFSEYDAPLYRISSGEPTLGRGHLIRLLELFDRPFLLETNGVLLDKDYCRILSSFHNLHVRLSFKGVDEWSFRETTGFSGFGYQMKAVFNLMDSKVPFHIALIDLFPENRVIELADLLWELGWRPNIRYPKQSSVLSLFEMEKFVWYPFIAERARGRGIELCPR